MLPVYRCTDSYPQQRNQMPFSQHYHPNLEAVAPQMKVDPAISPVTYESWPYGHGGNCGYPIPCHPCCNHNYFPGYYSFRPPYIHLPPPLFHCYGSYPAFSEAYPVHCVPPPHFSVEQPRYEYDKNVGRNYHCCGCPNHTSNWREDKNLKIEEHEPDVEKKGSDSLVPTELKNYPYPIVWLPPGYMKNKEHSKSFESELKDRNEVHRDTKPPESLESFEREPSVRNGWFPLDMNSLGSLIHGDDGKRNQSQQNEDKKNRNPFPIIWMPPYDKPEEVERKDCKETDTGPKSAEEPPSSLKIIPLKLSNSGDDSTDRPRTSEENPDRDDGLKMMEKKANQKAIPVKQTEQCGGKKTSEDIEGKGRGTPMKRVEDNGANKPSESSGKRNCSSPTKTSKLPPVCLRVDPLPRRKNSNSSLRFPGPPGLKGNSHELLDDTSKHLSGLKEDNQQDSQAPNRTLNKSKEVEPNKKERKVIEVVERIDGQHKNENLRNGSQTQIPVNLPNDSHGEIPRNPITPKAGTCGGECKMEEDNGARDAEEMTSLKVIEAKKATDKAQPADGECKIEDAKGASEREDKKNEEDIKAERKNKSDAEAAVIIQSAYRGYEARKWESLKKLKQIAEVREQVVEVWSRIQALESSSDLQRDEKQRVVIGETIMSLLLKLDAIQGFHPSLRDIRKSVARELVSLQEKVDSLTIQKSEGSIEEVSTAKRVEDFCANTHNVMCIQGGQNKEAKEVGLGNIISDSNDNSSDPIKLHQDQPLHMVDAASGSQCEEALESLPQLVDEEVHGKFEKEITELPVVSCVVPKAAEVEPIMEANNEESSGELDVSEVMTTEIQKENHEPYSDPELEPPIELPSVAEEKTNYEMEFTGSPSGDSIYGSNREGISPVVEVEDSTSLDKEPEMNQLMVELPVGLTDEEPAVPELEKHEQIKTGNNEVLQGGEVESSTAMDTTSPAVGEASSVDEFGHEPLEALKDEPSTTKLEDCVKIGPPKDDELGDDPGLESQELLAQPQGKEDNLNKELVEVVTSQEKEVGVVEETKEENGDQPVASGNGNGNGSVLVGMKLVRAHAEPTKEEVDLFPNSHTECDIGIESDKKLMEENDKLREILEKLIETGKEQLTVISNLNGRIQNLERKLSRKKTLRKRRYKAAATGSSYTKSSNNNYIKERTVGCAL